MRFGRGRAESAEDRAGIPVGYRRDYVHRDSSQAPQLTGRLQRAGVRLTARKAYKASGIQQLGNVPAGQAQNDYLLCAARPKVPSPIRLTRLGARPHRKRMTLLLEGSLRVMKYPREDAGHIAHGRQRHGRLWAFLGAAPPAPLKRLRQWQPVLDCQKQANHGFLSTIILNSNVRYLIQLM